MQIGCFLGIQGAIEYWDTENMGSTSRKMRMSPLYTRMEGDAVFGQHMGYERPHYFLTSTNPVEEEYTSTNLCMTA